MIDETDMKRRESPHRVERIRKEKRRGKEKQRRREEIERDKGKRKEFIFLYKIMIY